MSIDDVQTNQLLIQFAVVNVDVRTTQWTFFQSRLYSLVTYDVVHSTRIFMPLPRMAVGEGIIGLFTVCPWVRREQFASTKRETSGRIFIEFRRWYSLDDR